MHSAAANSEQAPLIQKNVPNHEPTDALSASPSALRKEMLLLSASCPTTVAYASIEVKRIVRKLMRTKVLSCSTLASRHQRRHRPSFASVFSKTKPVEGAAS